MKLKNKRRFVFFASVILLLVVFAFWYKATYSMDKASSYTINSTVLPTSIVIATQGSAFKDAIVTNIINFYKRDSVHIKTMDVSELQNLDHRLHTTIVILHTWEYGQPPQSVREFIYDNIKDKDKIIVFTTSGSGTAKIEGLDTMAGESIIENASDISDKIIEKIETLIN